MQIPPATEIAWRSDLAQYLEDEDQDTFAVSTRVAAQQCVLELLDWYGRKGLGLGLGLGLANPNPNPNPNPN